MLSQSKTEVPLAKTLPFTAHTQTGTVLDFSFPLHKDTASPMRVSQLVTTILGALDRDVRTLGETANGDILQALEAGPSRLSALLELCRWELQSRSEAHGFQPIFDAPELVDDLELSAREATNIIRIVREGITNAVRHAGASRISIRLWVSGSTLGMELRNDGAAERMDPAKWASGRGRRTIRARAGDLGGHADWRVDAKTGETLLSLSLCIGHGRDPELDPAV